MILPAQSLRTVLAGGVQVKEDGSPAGGAGIFLIRSDPRLQHLDTSRVYTTADPNGLFELKCPPGDYLLFTWTAGGQPLQPIPDFVISQGATARRISLQSKEEKQIELTISKPRK